MCECVSLRVHAHAHTHTPARRVCTLVPPGAPPEPAAKVWAQASLKSFPKCPKSGWAVVSSQCKARRDPVLARQTSPFRGCACFRPLGKRSSGLDLDPGPSPLPCVPPACLLFCCCSRLAVPGFPGPSWVPSSPRQMQSQYPASLTAPRNLVSISQPSVSAGISLLFFTDKVFLAAGYGSTIWAKPNGLP